MSNVAEALVNRAAFSGELLRHLTDGCWEGTAPARIEGLTPDSRVVRPGQLFVALPGERTHGVQHTAQAAEQGAVALLADEAAPVVTSCLPCLRVRRVDEALAALAAAHRQRWRGKLVALTGSTGKTTVKHFLAAALAAGETPVCWTPGNFNNHWGLPLALLTLRSEDAYAVMEIGMNAPGEIRSLGRLADPDLTLVLNARGAHREAFDSDEALSAEKASLYATTRPTGHCVGPAHDPRLLAALRASGRAYSSFGLAAPAEVWGRAVLEASGRTRVTLETSMGERFEASLPMPATYLAEGLAATLAVCAALERPLGPAWEALAASVRPVPGRLEPLAHASGALLLDASYNASPLAMLANLRSCGELAALRGGRAMACIGDMAELGASAPSLHAEVLAAAHKAGVQALYTLGPSFGAARLKQVFAGQHCEDLAEMQQAVRGCLQAEDVCLIQGANHWGLSALARRLGQADSAD